MDILIIGSGGREHALAWKLKRSPKIRNIFVAPGNTGTTTIAKNIELSSTEDIIEWVKKNHIGLVVVGPDNYLAEGIVDRLEALGVRTFGPTKAASEIEWSKAFAKNFMKEEGIPTANYQVFTDLQTAKSYVETQSFPVVIKASGLALGKGVIIAESLSEAHKALDEIMGNKIFGDAGKEVVIEEYLQGREISIHAFCDGENAVLFPPAQDHKRIFNGDQGPNTGGMGTIAPVPWVTDEQMEVIRNRVITPTIKALMRRGRPFKGILFPGIIITRSGPKVIEFNARFGDPETQSYMRILDTDLLDILFACINKNIDKQEVRWYNKSACCIVVASKGYPGNYEKGMVIEGLNKADTDEVVVFHAGTKTDQKKILTCGGRVLGVTSLGSDLKESLAKAYVGVGSISFEGMQFRNDIGAKSL